MFIAVSIVRFVRNVTERSMYPNPIDFLECLEAPKDLQYILLLQKGGISVMMCYDIIESG